MSFDVPEELYYLESHEWIDPDSGRVGITEFAQDELGDVVFVELPEEGEELSQEGEFGVVESIKAVSDLYSPADGEVRAVNEALFDRPELLNEDPFGEGWMLELDVAGELDGLLSAEEYREQIE
ncbi:glycine cleavage system protein GcvH [Halalkalicoccus tibetensis]|uniref:Probable glycine cleavage system H protein n=1 Tax=Halalkalicoccus tibetensis TaxID=175632 RepID=A0ABD5V439_9EURY